MYTKKYDRIKPVSDENARKAACVTLNYSTYQKIGQRMINTFLEYWPSDVTLYVYAEDFEVQETASNLVVFDLHKTIPELVDFKNLCKSDETKGKFFFKEGKGDCREQLAKDSNNLFMLYHANDHIDTEILFYFDSDLIFFSPISHEFLNKFIRGYAMGFPGRTQNFLGIELCIASFDLRDNTTKEFLNELGNVYISGKIWEFDQFSPDKGVIRQGLWPHYDIWIFEYVKENTLAKNRYWKIIDWCKEFNEVNHPIINSEWGSVLDHLKGPRKINGKSFKKDLVVTRTEDYWKDIK